MIHAGGAQTTRNLTLYSGPEFYLALKIALMCARSEDLPA